jgi:phosphate transport system substrate-binding protein
MRVRIGDSGPCSSSSECSRNTSRRCHSWYIWLLLLSIIQLWHIPSHAQDRVVLVGSGSSVPAPLYNRWAQEYGKHNPLVQIRYVPIGTSEGIKQIAHGTGDFGAGEARLTEQERKDGGLIELPAVLIGIVPIYNLPEVHQEIRLSGEVLAEIFLGELKTWNAPAIAKLNPDVTLPDLRIQVVNRPPGKGSNYVFTDFLSKVSSKFRSEIGVTQSPKWPVGTAAERSSDMVDKVKGQAGAIGFVELEYAAKSNLSTVAVLNSTGKFVKASEASIAAACESVEAPHWNGFSASLTNAGGADAYPITSFTWLYVRTDSSDSVRAAALHELLDWVYSEGQQYANQAGYSELPPPLVAAVRKKVKELR